MADENRSAEQTNRPKSTGGRLVQARAQVRRVKRTVATAVVEFAGAVSERVPAVVAPMRRLAYEARRLSSLATSSKARRLPVKAQVWRMKHLVAAVEAERKGNEEAKTLHLKAAQQPITAAEEFDATRIDEFAAQAAARNDVERENYDGSQRVEAAVTAEWNAFATTTATGLEAAQADLADAIQLEVAARQAFYAANDDAKALRRRIAGLPKSPSDFVLNILPEKLRLAKIDADDKVAERRAEMEATLESLEAVEQSARADFDLALGHTAERRVVVDDLLAVGRAKSIKLNDSIALRRQAERDAASLRRKELAKVQAKTARTDATERKAAIERALS